MNERVESKIINFCVVKLSNSPAITCVPRLELDHFESQPDSLRINQRLPKLVGSLYSIRARFNDCSVFVSQLEFAQFYRSFLCHLPNASH